MDALMSMVSPVAMSSQTREESQRDETQVRRVSFKQTPTQTFREQFAAIYVPPENNTGPKLSPTTRLRPVGMFLT